MAEFFRGWKRKAGLVTLMLACLFAAGWMRSRIIADLFFSTSTTRDIQLRSVDSVLLFRVSRQMTGSRIYGNNQLISWNPIKWQESDVNLARVQQSLYWERSFCGLIIGSQFDSDAGWDIDYVIIPYRWVVIPLTILSAWLLLSESRSPEHCSSPRPDRSEVNR